LNHANHDQRVPQMSVTYVVSLNRASYSVVSYLVMTRRGG